jgi:hypothetical protein
MERTSPVATFLDPFGVPYLAAVTVTYPRDREGADCTNQYRDSHGAVPTNPSRDRQGAVHKRRDLSRERKLADP